MGIRVIPAGGIVKVGSTAGIVMSSLTGFSFKVSAKKSSTDTIVATTVAIDTTGVKLLVVSGSVYDVAGGANLAFTDSASNTWVKLTQRRHPTIFHTNQLAYVIAPTTSATHTFTLTLASKYPAIFVAGYSHSGTILFDQEVGATGTTPTSSGSVTPAKNNSLLVSGVAHDSETNDATIDAGFTLRQQAQQINAQAVGGGIADLKQNTAAAINPAWTATGSTDMAVGVAVFKV